MKGIFAGTILSSLTQMPVALPDPQPDRNNIEAYYDGHATEVQQRSGLNQRHHSIFRKAKKAGLRRDHTVLEIGCGIGLLSGLFAKFLDRGKLLSLDISPKAVAMAQARLADRSNVSFMISDMSAFRSDLIFDRVVLPDVLEHIPEGDHQALFETIGRHLATDGKVLIHIPDPYALDRLRIENPELLQIVDQSLAILPMVERFNAIGLVLERYEPYGLWAKDPDYDWIVFSRPRSQGSLAKRHRVDSLLRELRSRLSL